jgi:hypothetical protein
MRRADILTWAADRAAQDPTFLGSDLREYATTAQLDKESLAEYLSCAVLALPKLSLCFRPNPESPDFVNAAEKIAAYAGADSDQLIALIRHVDALRAMRRVPSSTNAGHPQALMMAARERRQGDHPKSRGRKSDRSRE